MNILVQSSDESNHKSEASSSSEASYSNRLVHSHDEEVILASARPKKRAGRRIFKETRHPVYRGVRRRNKNKWVCEVRVPNNKSRIWLGTYPTPEMAARAHDVAALTLRGRSTCLNFADSVWRLPLPESTDPEDIKRVAAEAAELAFVQQQGVEAITDYNAVCSSSSVEERVMEDSSKNSVQEEGMHANEAPAVTSAFDDEDLHDWLVSMANEPLRSPTPFVRYGNSRDWNEGEVDAEMSWWDFTI